MNRAIATQPTSQTADVAEPAEHLTPQLGGCEALGAARGILLGVVAGGIVWTVALVVILVIA